MGRRESFPSRGDREETKKRGSTVQVLEQRRCSELLEDGGGGGERGDMRRGQGGPGGQSQPRQRGKQAGEGWGPGLGDLGGPPEGTWHCVQGITGA